MMAFLLSDDLMLSELLLNDGYSKEQLAASLDTSLSQIDDVLSPKHKVTLKRSFQHRLKQLYLLHHHA